MTESTSPPSNGGPLNDEFLEARTPGQYKYGFLVVPNFSYIGFASAIEPLRLANLAAGERRFSAGVISLDGAPTPASNGFTILPDVDISGIPDELDAVFVVGPNPIHFPGERELAATMKRLAHDGVALGGICTGSYLMARAGLLDGYRCTIHWQDTEELLQQFPELIVSTHLFEIDRQRCTSSGGTASMDMMLRIIAGLPEGAELAAATAELLVHDRVRDAGERQRIPLRLRLGSDQPQLAEAAMIMEANLEDPISLSELAGHVGVSERQLERMFRAALDCTPSQYYMEIRLQHARQLLRSSSLSVSEVARDCGFVSGSHFARRYARHFGMSPSAEKRRSGLTPTSS
ncbi:GlxA family transcriptional regulator [Aquisalimonas lutea]|uniref:GlxA family transcriptional regulator n=1 Tax=Aquisalimonas lutea TaxID=1327750 RepID=UPI0025B5FBCB|nr:GlxA family transcriptional regulator [Aquisalimonas lutea]MDN3519871.1 GlxA family transcriptional regulator [Aquisalimonas lutea]